MDLYTKALIYICAFIFYFEVFTISTMYKRQLNMHIQASVKLSIHPNSNLTSAYRVVTDGFRRHRGMAIHAESQTF